MLIINNCEVIKRPDMVKNAYKALLDLFPYEYTREGKKSLRIALNASGEITVSDGEHELPGIFNYNPYTRHVVLTHTEKNNFKIICEFDI